MRKVLVAILPFGLLATFGCANDPVYIPGTEFPGTGASVIPSGMDDGTGVIVGGRASLTLPINAETPEDAAARALRMAALAPIEVPYVKVGDLEVSVEWTIRNLTDMPANAKLELNGANDSWTWDPSLIIPADPDDPPAPPLQGGVPLDVPPSGTLSGLFREDELREASIDLDQITRANINPYRATLTISKNAASFEELTPLTYDANGEPLPQSGTGVIIPREAFRQMLRIDLVFTADRAMELEYSVRVRDIRGIMADRLMDAPVAELAYDPASFMPPSFVPPTAAP